MPLLVHLSAAPGPSDVVPPPVPVVVVVPPVPVVVPLLLVLPLLLLWALLAAALPPVAPVEVLLLHAEAPRRPRTPARPRKMDRRMNEAPFTERGGRRRAPNGQRRAASAN